MRRVLLLIGLILAFGLLQEAVAQSKAYAPDNLQGLNEADRVRVIEREYADQSNGARIPDDQLEFYLDQIRSGWRFSDIKNDISLSLGGTGSGWRPGPGSGSGPGWGDNREVLCESRDRRPTECQTPFRGVARMSRQISSARCSVGRDWGSRPGMVWVSNGCDVGMAPESMSTRLVTEVGAGARGSVPVQIRNVSIVVLGMTVPMYHVSVVWPAPGVLICTSSAGVPPVSAAVHAA